MKTLACMATASCALLVASLSSAAAAPHYGARYVDPAYDPYDGLAPAGLVVVWHRASCTYPNGWSSGEFSRDLNGIPRSDRELRAAGC